MGFGGTLALPGVQAGPGGTQDVLDGARQLGPAPSIASRNFTFFLFFFQPPSYFKWNKETSHRAVWRQV